MQRLRKTCFYSASGISKVMYSIVRTDQLLKEWISCLRGI